MSLELRDLRTKITPETYCALVAAARVSGKDQAEIARNILHAWAEEQMRTAMVLQGLLASEGLIRSSGGVVPR